MKIFSSKRPWYADGLAFECTGCGSCCAGPAEGYVWATKAEIATIAEYLGIGEDEMHRKYVRKIGRRYSLVEEEKSKDCIFLVPNAKGGGKVCRIYPVRPMQCQTWPFWAFNLLSPGAWSQAAMRCPGINRGPSYSCDEIEQRRKVTRA